MSSSTGIFAIILSAVLTNNFIFSQFLGCCPFLGCSSKIDTAAGMGLAVTFVMGLASAICWLVNCLLVKLGLGFLQTIAYILVIAALVQFIEMFLKKSIPLFLFIFVIIRLFRFRYTFYHVNDYGIKLCGVLRCNDRPPGILFDILSNLASIAAATTGNLLTFRKTFRLMCF